MALPQRIEQAPAARAGDVAGRHYAPGSEVGRLQAELARRLVGAPVPVSASERLVRALSVAGGVVALVAGYGGVVLLLLR